MGAWGTGLYQDDETLDMKDVFEVQYRKGKSKEEIVAEMEKQFKRDMINEEDNNLYWIVLGDLEWKKGMLDDVTKEKAIESIEKEIQETIWKEEGEKEYQRRVKVLEGVKQKIQTEQPKVKRHQRRPFVCKWKIGDIYAYQLTQEESKDTPYHNKYVVFQKVDNTVDCDDNIVPVVRIYNKIFDQIPLKDEIILFNKFLIFKNEDYDIKKFYYRCLLLSRFTKFFKKENLRFIGNLPIKSIENDNFISEGEQYEFLNWKYFDLWVIKIYEYTNHKYKYDK